MKLSPDCIGIKAKTPEGLNLDNAAMAQVVVLLEEIPKAVLHAVSPRHASPGNPHDNLLTSQGCNRC